QVEQQEDNHQRYWHHDLQASFSALEVFELAAPDQVSAGRELHLFSHRLLRCGDITTEVAITDVDEDIGRQFCILGANAVGNIDKLDVRDFAQRHRAAVGQGHKD